MERIDSISIENYERLEDREVLVGGRQIVSFTCESCADELTGEDIDDDTINPDEGYPYKYIAGVTVGGRWAEGYAWQRNEWESAYHDGFEEAYKMACRKLGVEPIKD